MENKTTLDKSAPVFFNKNNSTSYDERSQRMAPIIDNLHFLIGLILKNSPTDANILCVGVGTGAEIIRLAEAHPGWRFTGIDPSADMLEVCRAQLEKNGLSSRATLFHGYLSEFSGTGTFDAVLCLFVTQFVKDSQERQTMFNAMAARLNPKGYLISAELSEEVSSPEFHDLLEKWKTLQLATGSSEEQVAKILEAWQQHVAIVPPASIEAILRQSGFSMPIQFFQSFLMHAWYSQKD
jgi:tRNA (cmo5U34)-methyltransferase